jgi:hypothetical protein
MLNGDLKKEEIVIIWSLLYYRHVLKGLTSNQDSKAETCRGDTERMVISADFICDDGNRRGRIWAYT